MSLIADALRKSEVSSAGSPPTLPTRRSLWIYRGLLLISVLGVLAGVARGRLQQTDAPAPTAVAVSEPASHAAQLPSRWRNAATGRNLFQVAERQWRLNGIVEGGPGRSLALINNELVSEGDSIRGATVVRVDTRRVDLQIGKKIQTLTLED